LFDENGLGNNMVPGLRDVDFRYPCDPFSL